MRIASMYLLCPKQTCARLTHTSPKTPADTSLTRANISLASSNFPFSAMTIPSPLAAYALEGSTAATLKYEQNNTLLLLRINGYYQFTFLVPHFTSLKNILLFSNSNQKRKGN